MARAHFRFAIGPEGRQPGAPICAGDIAEGTIVVQTPKAHTNAKVIWFVEWVAEGRTTDRARVAGGTHVIGNLYPDMPEVVRLRLRIPAEGPVSYRGTLLNISWRFQATLDIPWAIDPSSAVGFQVLPRPVSAPPPPRVPGAPPPRIYAQPAPTIRAQARTRAEEVCPFCRDDVLAAERWACPRCQTPHHQECFSLYGRCTIPGCG